MRGAEWLCCEEEGTKERIEKSVCCDASKVGVGIDRGHIRRDVHSISVDTVVEVVIRRKRKCKQRCCVERSGSAHGRQPHLLP